MKKGSQKDYDFFIKTDLSRYQGKYVAIAGEEIISSGYNAKIVYEKARKKAPHLKPTLAKIPSEDIMILVFKSDCL